MLIFKCEIQWIVFIELDYMIVSVLLCMCVVGVVGVQDPNLGDCVSSI